VTHRLELLAGPAASPCTHVLTFGLASVAEVSQNQVYPSGIAIPAGDALGLFSDNDGGAAAVYGYLVPASTVPGNVLQSLPAAQRGDLVTK
jgi:hypothetical protein